METSRTMAHEAVLDEFLPATKMWKPRRERETIPPVTEVDPLKPLNELLRLELEALGRYTVFAARCRGLERPHLAEFFRRAASSCLAHAQKLADKITALGGKPEGNARIDLSECPEGNHAMLRAALATETEALSRYADLLPHTRRQPGLHEMILHIILEEQQDADDLKKMIEGK